MKLHIPPDSLPADFSQCRVEVKASLSGQYTLPADCELVSGVYWIKCAVKPSKPVTLELQHSSRQREGMSFIWADHYWGQLPISFQKQKGGVFSQYSSQGSISLYTFSHGWGIVARKSRSSVAHQYSAQVCYADVNLNTWQVLFTVRCRRGLDLEDTVCAHLSKRYLLTMLEL